MKETKLGKLISKFSLNSEKKSKKTTGVVGIFEEKENNKSMTRVLTFMTTTTACAIIIMQEVAHLIIADYETHLAAPSLLLGYSAGKKLTQKHMETRNQKFESPKLNDEILDDEKIELEEEIELDVLDEDYSGMGEENEHDENID